MDRKSKIWIWVLALLLVAALGTSVMFKLKLDDTKGELDVANTHADEVANTLATAQAARRGGR